MKLYLVIFCVFPIVFAQSEILNRFLKLNRDELKISGKCDNDLNLIDKNLNDGEIWALKCE